MEIGSLHYMVVSVVVFSIGVAGVITRRNIIVMMMSIELMLNAANLAFITFAKDFANPSGHVFVLIVIAVAAAEAAVGLALVLALFRNKGSVDIDNVDSLKG